MERTIMSPNGDLTRVTVSGTHVDVREVPDKATVKGEKSGGHNLEISEKQGHEWQLQN